MTPEEETAYRKNVLVAVLSTCLAYFLFNCSDAILKLMIGRFHFTQVMSLNSAFIVFFMALFGGLREGKKAFRTDKLKMMLIRAGVSQITSFCNILALPHIRLTTFYTLVFTSPLWVALLSAVFMKDKLDARRLSVVLFGFAVVLYIFRPDGQLPSLWMMLVLLGAFAYSCQMLIVRRIGLQESRFFLFMSGAFLNLMIVAPFVAPHFVMPQPYEWALFICMAAIGTVGLLFIGYAFQSAPSASIVAPYHYTQIIWGGILGYLFFQEVPDARVMMGSVAIIAAGLYLVWDERRRPLLRVGGV